MKRTLLFLLCVLMGTQLFSETLFGYLFPTLAYLDRTTCHYTEGDEQFRTINRLSFEDNMFEVDGNTYIEYNNMWLREDKEGRILVYSEPAKKDLVLYDFTLEVGDTLTTLNIDMVPMTEGDPILPGVKPIVVDYPIYINGELSCPIDTLIVTDVFMVMMRDSNEYKKWTFSNGMEYMEYIGNLGADFFPIIKNPWEDIPTCCIEERLVCASIYDRLVYLMDDEKRDLLNIDCPCTSWSNKWQWRTNTWNVLQFDGMAFEQTAQTWQYELAHDTIIGGKEYTAVTRHWTAYDESAAEYVAAVRFAENKKAFIYYDNAEYLLYDFGYHEIGDTLEVFSGINNYEHFKTYKCVITDNYSTAGGIAEDTYVMDIIHPITGDTIPSALVWQEFVGSYSGFLHGGLLVPGNSNYQLLCAYKDNVLAYSVDNDAFTDNDTFIEYGCEYNVEQKPKYLFPTLWGLQQTICSGYYGEEGDEWASGLTGPSQEITMMDGKPYLQWGSWYLREENDKILVYSEIQKKDLVLYDFTLELGDTLTTLNLVTPEFLEYEGIVGIVDYPLSDYDYTYPIDTLVVTELSKETLLDGKEYTRWKFSDGTVYVEGIGSMSETFFHHIADHLPVPVSYLGSYLVCVSKNNKLLYQMDDAEMERLGAECLCEAENPEDLFPTLWGLQRTVCKEYYGETEDDNSANSIYKQTFDQIFFENDKPYILCNDYLLREEDNKILIYSQLLNKDLVLYDFTLEVGDSLPALYIDYHARNAMDWMPYNLDVVDYYKSFDGTIYPADTFIVTDISNVTLFDGKEYKKWTFNNGMEYVEGIGSFGNRQWSGDFFQLIANRDVPTSLQGEHLVCVSKNNKLLYQMDDAEMERLGAECLCDYDRGPRKDNAKDGQIGGRPTPTQWNQLEVVLRQMDNNHTILQAETFSYTLEDISQQVNNKTYFQLARQSTKDTATTKSVVGALHFGEDEDNRVYFLRDGVEYVLYDFTAEPGDTVEIFAGINNYPQETTYTHVVVDKDTTEDGACRMFLEVVFPDETNATAENAEKVWLAGLGSVDGIVHNAAKRTSNAHAAPSRSARSSETESSVMLCAWREDSCLYTTNHPDYDTFGCVYNQDPTAVEDISTSQSSYQKLLRDGQLFIIHDGKTYNVLGVPVE